eukprot:CAMPEP_0117451668 /NCGR_PEP_ID=MMETSP0759-20121206/9138_1 /TAXON_ID=63605 /ORGANISM="Percolomonas cosmopolitus, Strain WS" /LENGTH=236 /DNA_ID=CAMNT_0005244299 /DNA_START=9 /DNA_END=719 /DNA_ORIENTATION=+
MSHHSHSLLLVASLFLLFSIGIISSAYQNADCGSPCLGADNNKCGRYERIEYTVELKESATNETLYFPFCPSVDKFSRVTLRGSYKWITQSGRSISNAVVTIGVGSVRSPERQYSDGTNFASSLTSILIFGAYGTASGVLKGITWDDTCSGNRCIFDNSDRCVGGLSCGTAIADPELTTDDQRDVSIFIGCRGSGKFGNIFTSINEIPSTYRALSFAFKAVQMYDKARDIDIPVPW